MTSPSPDRLKVMWAKGRNYYSSFYTELAEARRTINDDAAFAIWCRDELGISVDVFVAASAVLKRADAATVRRNLAQAREIEAARRRVEREERQIEVARRRAERDRIREEKALAIAREIRNRKAREKREEKKRQLRIAAE